MKIGLSKLLATLYGALLFNSSSAQTRSGPKTEKPNIIIILADDLGYSDLGCYGGEIETPNLDWLSSKGVRFNSFYNASRCCPSRASLLTGLYQHQAGIGDMTTDQHTPGYRGSLKSNAVTIAQVLRQAGYQTGMAGKWHVSETVPFQDKQKQLDWLSHQITDKDFGDTLSYPTHKGFQKYYGTIWGVVDYFDPFALVNGTRPVKTVPPGYYYTDAIGDTSASYVKQFSKNGQPFFMYLAYTAPHWPLMAKEQDIKKYEHTYKKGWKYIREQRYRRMVSSGLINPREVRLSDFMYPDEKWETNKDSVWDARAMAVHAAMVDCLDQNIGKLINQLKTSGQLDNTLIMFLSDNGASPERPELFLPGFDRAGSTRDGREVSSPADKDIMPGPQTTMSGIGPQWANVSCTPFRYWKSKEHEGGISTPFIAFWPGVVKAENSISNVPAHIIDLMATCIDAGQANYPSTFEGNEISPAQGLSLRPVFTGKVKDHLHKELFWEHNGAAALRQGDWKIVRATANEPWELYNLKEDRSETTDLSSKYPQKVPAMAARWKTLADQYMVFPKPGKRIKD